MARPGGCVRERSVVAKRVAWSESKDLSCLFGKTSVGDSQVVERKERARDLLFTASPRSGGSGFSAEGWFFACVTFIPVRKG